MKYRIGVVCLVVVTFLFGCGNGNVAAQAGEGASTENINCSEFQAQESMMESNTVESDETALSGVNTTIFRYGEKEYNLADINHNINAIMGVTEVGNYLVVEGHTGPKNAVYCIFNVETQEFEKEIIGANLVWHSDDITTCIYNFWNEIYNYEGELVVTCDIVEPDFIYSIEFIEDNTKIEVEINPVSKENYKVRFDL